MAKRRTRRTAIADHLWTDITSIEPYQPGQTRIPVYLAGSRYVVALRAGERPPDGFGTWVYRGSEGPYTLHVADTAAEG